MGELVTEEQALLLAIALIDGKSLLTAREGKNAACWSRMAELGYLEEVDSPFPALRAFAFTDAGRAFLSPKDTGGEDA